MDPITIAIIVGIIGLVFAVAKATATKKITASTTVSRLIFVVGKTENLDAAFGRAPGMKILAPDGSEVTHLNKCNIGCTNVGTSAIKELKFDVIINGDRKYISVDFKGGAKGVATGASYVSLRDREGVKVSVPFLNPKESLPLSVWFDGPRDQCKVECRLEGVECTAKHAKSTVSDYVRDVGPALAAATPVALWGILESIVNRGDTSGDSGNS
jgi:hypothetical protein